MPRSGPGVHRLPSAAATTTSGLWGSITICAMDLVSSSPRETQVLPASVDHVWVARGNCKRAHGAGVKLSVRDVLPGITSIAGLPYTTAGCAHVVSERLGGDTHNRRYAAAAIRSDASPVQSAEMRGVERDRAGRTRGYWLYVVRLRNESLWRSEKKRRGDCNYRNDRIGCGSH